jgi:hypothetical protein
MALVSSSRFWRGFIVSSGTSESPKTGVLSVSEVIAGKYRIDGVLAEGGMGIVYRGWHLTLALPIAIKVMRSELARRPDSAMRFLNEARSAARLRGQHIARVLDIGALGDSLNGSLYMVLELLDGADLRSILDREGPLPPDRAIRYVLGACDALSEVHAAGIVHRDVKPDNLFLARESGDIETMKLLDFGISKNLHGSRGFETYEGLGSPLYMAPEQLAHAAQVDARADIWSLGVVLYELLSDRVPFEGHNLAEICGAVMDLEPEPLSRSCPHVSPALEAIVLRCLSKRPEDRFRTIHELSFALRALQCQDPSDAPALALGSCLPARPRHWRRRIAFGVAAAAIASAIPLSTRLGAFAARAPALPTALQASPASPAVDRPGSARSGPVVRPVPDGKASDPGGYAEQRQGADQRADCAEKTRVSDGRRAGVPRDTWDAPACVCTLSRPSFVSSSERIWPGTPVHRLIVPYEPGAVGRIEPKPDEAPRGNELGFVALEPGMMMRVYGSTQR